VKEKILGTILFWIYRLVMMTWRLKVQEAPQVTQLRKDKKPFIIAHWHGDELGILNQVGHINGVVLVSASKDGQILATVLQKFGGKVVRGSSSKNSIQGLKGLIRMIKTGRCPVIAVDGPRGPLKKAKPGAFQVSKLGQIPIIPLSFWCSKPKLFKKTWSQEVLPKPFSLVSIYFGVPMDPVRKDQSPKSAELSLALSDALRVTRDHAKLLGSKK